MNSSKRNKREEEKENLKPWKSYSDASILVRLFTSPRKLLLPYFKNNTTRKGWLLFSPFWAILSIIIFSIQWSTTCLMRIHHGTAYSGLIVTWIAFFGMIVLNRPLSVEELGLVGNEVWNILSTIFTGSEIDLKHSFLILFNPDSVFFLYAICFQIFAHTKIFMSYLGKGTSEERLFSGYNILYLALKEYAPVSDTFMKTTFEPAFWGLVSMLFFANEQWLPGIWFASASLIILVMESGTVLFRKAYSM